jgi:hypothetical protein
VVSSSLIGYLNGRPGRDSTLIAQSCIDHDVPLITADTDFRHYAPLGLRLYA